MTPPSSAQPAPWMAHDAPSNSVDPQMTRRLFLQAIAAGATVAALPAWLAEPAAAATPLGGNDGVLVLVTMAGGNDGLSTFIPTTNGAYHDARRGMAFSPKQTHRLNDDRGLHPSLPYFKKLWDRGDLAVIDGVGHHDSTLSHFESMGSVMMARYPGIAAGTGWVGRYLDDLGNDPFHGVSLGSVVPMLVKGRARQAIGVPDYRNDVFQTGDTSSPKARQFRALRSLGLSPTGLGPLADMTAAAGRRAVDLSGTVRPLFEEQRAEARVITKFRLAARLINANLGVRVISIVFGDFDSHANQAAMHRDRMIELNTGVETFFQTLDPTFSTRTLIVGTSEFGRRVKSNGSGTDHGRANSLFAIGHQVNGGFHGQMPSLTRLDRHGNLEPTLDFRHLYDHLLTTWLGADAGRILGRDHGGLGIVNRPGQPVGGKAAPGSAPATTTIRQRRARISRLHLALFQADPDEADLDRWSQALASGARSLDSLANALTRSDRFKAAYGSLNNRQFVELIYRNVLERAADASGLRHWVGVLDRGTARGTVVLNFSESTEFRERTAARVWRIEVVGPIGRLYRAYFLRRPDERGLTYWINTALALPAISNTFANSTEFLNRYGTLTNEEFVRLVYRNVLGRAAETKGLRYWLDQANGGTLRGDIMLGFSNSTEFIRKVRLLE